VPSQAWLPELAQRRKEELRRAFEQGKAGTFLSGVKGQIVIKNTQLIRMSGRPPPHPGSKRPRNNNQGAAARAEEARATAAARAAEAAKRTAEAARAVQVAPLSLAGGGAGAAAIPLPPSPEENARPTLLLNNANVPVAGRAWVEARPAGSKFLSPYSFFSPNNAFSENYVKAEIILKPGKIYKIARKTSKPKNMRFIGEQGGLYILDNSNGERFGAKITGRGVEYEILNLNRFKFADHRLVRTTDAGVRVLLCERKGEVYSSKVCQLVRYSPAENVYIFSIDGAEQALDDGEKGEYWEAFMLAEGEEVPAGINIRANKRGPSAPAAGAAPAGGGGGGRRKTRKRRTRRK